MHEDILVIYKDAAGEWRWRRVAAGNYEPIASSGEGYRRQIDCLTSAQRVNAEPYTLTIDGGVDGTVDLDPAVPYPTPEPGGTW